MNDFYLFVQLLMSLCLLMWLYAFTREGIIPAFIPFPTMKSSTLHRCGTHVKLDALLSITCQPVYDVGNIINISHPNSWNALASMIGTFSTSPLFTKKEPFAMYNF